VLELLQHALDPFLLERVLVPRLRGRQHEQVLGVLVLDQRLVERRLVVDDIDEVVHDATLAAHDEVEVAQAHVEVDDRGLVAAERQSGRERRARGGLADASLAGGHYDGLGHHVPVCPLRCARGCE